MQDSQLSDLSQKIRDLWVSEVRLFELRNTGVATGWGQRYMPFWDGGVTSKGHHRSSVWDRIAKFCAEHRLVPELLVKAVFYHARWKPEPNQAAGDTALARYKLYVSPGTILERKNQIRHVFETQKSRAICEVTRQKQYFSLDDIVAWRSTLVDTQLPLTPLFRYCVAVNQGWNDLAEDFEDSAVAQYVCDAEIYDEVWGDWLPASIKTMKPAWKEASL